MGRRDEITIAKDRAKVCELMLRGYRSRTEIASIINLDREDVESQISNQQVAKDIEYMKNQYLERGFEDLAVYKHQAIDELTYLMKTYFQEYEKSRGNFKTTIETEDLTDEAGANEIYEYPDSIVNIDKKVKTKKEYKTVGDVAFLNGAKACIESLNKIKGVDGATKVSLTDPSGMEESSVLEMMKFKMNELSEPRDVGDESEAKLLGTAYGDVVVDGELIEQENE